MVGSTIEVRKGHSEFIQKCYLKERFEKIKKMLDLLQQILFIEANLGLYNLV